METITAPTPQTGIFRVEEEETKGGASRAVSVTLDLGPREKLAGKGVDRKVMREVAATWKRRNVPLSSGVLHRLERAADDAIRIEPLSGHRAIGLIRDQTYRPEVIRRLGQAGEHLRQCGRIARRVRVFRFSRPWRLEGLDGALQALLENMQGITPPAGAKGDLVGA